jgi:hypothetical protein
MGLSWNAGRRHFHLSPFEARSNRGLAPSCPSLQSVGVGAEDGAKRRPQAAWPAEPALDS